MPLQIIRNDITKMKVDAIVNAANNSLLGGGGVDGAIHRAAGKELLAECRTLGCCDTGKAKITRGYGLDAKYVIHTVGPIYEDGKQGERELLESCYRESLALAKEYKCESVAFPLISAGVYGYPKAQAFRVAVDTITEFLLENDMLVYIVLFGKEAFMVSEKLFADITEYIDDRYVERHTDKKLEKIRKCAVLGSVAKRANIESAICEASSAPEDLSSRLSQIDESFSQMLLRKIDERGITDSECYKRANIDRKLFSKIRKDVNYKPSKPTVIAFAIALKLTLAETEEMLKKAGFALSHSNKFDIIIEYFISKGIFDIFEINEVLFAFDQSLLGA